MIKLNTRIKNKKEDDKLLSYKNKEGKEKK